LWVNGDSVGGCSAVLADGEVELHRFPFDVEKTPGGTRAAITSFLDCCLAGRAGLARAGRRFVR
jgi:hypothetical protein